MLLEENDYDTDEYDDNYNEFTPDIIEEFNYDIKIETIDFYKDLLLKEPEFIGIKNICSGKILNIVETTTNITKLNKNDYKLNFEQYNIFKNMYSELDLQGNENLFNIVTKKIFSIIYI